MAILHVLTKEGKDLSFEVKEKCVEIMLRLNGEFEDRSHYLSVTDMSGKLMLFQKRYIFRVESSINETDEQ